MNKIMTKTPEEIENESHISLKLRYNSLAEAALKLQEENRKLTDLIEAWQQKLENAQKNVDINKKIVMNSILGQNQMKEDFANEINILTSKLKKAQDALG